MTRKTSSARSSAAVPSAYIGEDGRTDAETYLEGVADGSIVAGEPLKRLAAMMLPRFADGYKQWHYDPWYATRPVEFIENFCCYPAGRKMGQPFVLEPYERMWVELIFGFVDDDGIRQFQRTIIEVARKNGKALSLDTEIPTANGWKAMADVHPGDCVYGPDGKLARVLVESPVFDKPMYLVTFEDGSTIKASGDHIWTVTTKTSRRKELYYRTHGHKRKIKERRPGGWFDTTTAEMSGDFKHLRHDGKGTEYRYRVPMTSPVKKPEVNLLIDPYLMGAWLGDGTSTKPEITIADQDAVEMVPNLEKSGYHLWKHDYPSCKYRTPTYTIGRHGKYRSGHQNTFLIKLDIYDLIGNKHIPDDYMNASIEQRMELLRGLMDTDGYCSNAGECEFSQKSEHFVDQFRELLASLGIKSTKHKKHVRCNGKNCEAWSALFFCDQTNPCFKLSRKRVRLKERLAPRMRAKSIVNIERIPNEPSKCIAVDNDSHLYLAGRQYTTTHNTSLLAAIELYMLISDGEGAPQVYNSAVTGNQASLGYGAAMHMLRKSPKLRRYIREGAVKERDNQSGLICDATLGYICTLSGDSKSLDGLDIHFAVLDELAAWKKRDVFDLIMQSIGAREQPLIMAISTQGFIRDGIWDTEIAHAHATLEGKEENDRLLPILYEMDSRDEMYDEAAWPKANPGLGTVKKLQYMRDQASKARNDPTYRPTFLTKDLNLPANQAVAFLTYEECRNEATWELADGQKCYAVIGFDAADFIDLTAARALIMFPDDNHIYERSMYWLPEKSVEMNGNRERDNVPYHIWEAQGLLRIVQGNVVPRQVLLDWIQELYDSGVIPFAVGYDPWHVEQPIIQQLKMYVGESRVVPVRQGALTLSSPMKELKSDLAENRVVDNHNPVNEWCRMNVAAKVDVNQNVQPVKVADAKHRIDGFMAELDAYVVLRDMWDEYQAWIA